MGDQQGRRPGESERGEPAGFDRKSGEVHGSGSGSGGGNPGEDHDDDPKAGGGSSVGGPRPIDEADQRPIDPDEGI